MPGFDDELASALAEIDAEGSEVPAETGPRMRQTRRTVLDTVDIEGAPDGTGSVVMGGGGRVELGREVDADAPIKGTASREQHETAPEDARRRQLQEYDSQEHAPIADAMRVGDLGSQQRAARRIADMLGRLRSDPVGTMGAAASGAMQGISGGLADEITGAALSSTIMGPQDPVEGMRMMREGRESLRARAPEAYGASEVGGMVGGAVASPSLPMSRAPGLLGAGARIASGVGTGALYGGAAGVGAADAETPEEALDAFVGGGFAGGVIGGGGALVGETGRAGLQAVQRAGAGRDRALLAATGGASGATPATRRFERVPGGDGAAAERMRRMGIVPTVGTVGQIEQRAGAARSAAGGQIQRAFDLTEGRAIPTQDFVERLTEAARGFDRPTARGAQSAVQRMIDDVAQAYPDGVPFQAAQDMIEDLRDSGAFVGGGGDVTPLGRQAQQQIYRSMRSAMDDWVRELGGTEAMGAYQEARLDQQVARIAERNAREAGQRGAGNLGIGLMDYIGAGVGGALGTAAGSPVTGAVLGGALTHGYRATQGTLRASGAELAYRIAQRSPERFGPAAQAIIQAGQRGGAELQGTVQALAQRDERFRRELEAAMAEEESGDTTPSAVRAIGASASPQTVTDWLTETLRTNPEALGRYAAQFGAGVPPATVHFLLSQRDPEYRATVERARQQESDR
jgi:hypothetical protein